MKKRAGQHAAEKNDGRRLPKTAVHPPLATLQPGVFQHTRPQIVRRANTTPGRADQRLNFIQRLRIISWLNHNAPRAVNSPGEPRAWSSRIDSGWQPYWEI